MSGYNFIQPECMLRICLEKNGFTSRKCARMKLPIITCRQASHVLSKREDVPLNTKENLQLWIHLCICDACRHVAQQFALVRRAMHQWRERD